SRRTTRSSAKRPTKPRPVTTSSLRPGISSSRRARSERSSFGRKARRCPRTWAGTSTWNCPTGGTSLRLKALFRNFWTTDCRLRQTTSRARRERKRRLNRMKATWNGAVLAESDDTVVVEGNHYFPPDSIKREHLRESETHTVCPWKGTAS